MRVEGNGSSERRSWGRTALTITAAVFVATVLLSGVGSVGATAFVENETTDNGTGPDAGEWPPVETGNCTGMIPDAGDDDADAEATETVESTETPAATGTAEPTETPAPADTETATGTEAESTTPTVTGTSTGTTTTTGTPTATQTPPRTVTSTGPTTTSETATPSGTVPSTATETATGTETATATPTATATETETPTETATEADGFDERAVERLVHQRINEIRRNAGLNALDHDPELRSIARAHSRDMAVEDYFSHTAPDGDSFVDRYEQAGYDCPTGGGENIAMRGVAGEPSESALAEAFVDMWMNSTGHRENILRERWNAEGIGVYYDGEAGEVYATQNFC